MKVMTAQVGAFLEPEGEVHAQIASIPMLPRVATSLLLASLLPRHRAA